MSTRAAKDAGPFIGAIEAVSRAGVALSAAMVALIFLLMLAEIIARGVFRTSTLMSWELSSYLMAAVIFVATTGCTGRQLPPVFGPSGPTAHRRFTEWTAARVWAKLHRLILDELGSRGELDWSRCAIDSVNMRALKRGS